MEAAERTVETANTLEEEIFSLSVLITSKDGDKRNNNKVP